MALNTLMKDLVLSTDATALELREEGSGYKIEGAGEHDDFVDALNSLRALNLEGKLPDGIDEVSLARRVSPKIDHLCFNSVKDIKTILVIKLFVSSIKVNELLKTEMSIDLIDFLSQQYLEIVSILQSLKSTTGYHLLTKCSFMSPLLITISFSLKLNYSRTNQLIKLLAILFNYHLRPGMLSEIIKLFTINPSTDMDVFEVFNKLWSKTFEVFEKSLDSNYWPGPITIIERVESLHDYGLSLELINEVLPYDLRPYLGKISKDLVAVHSKLSLLSEANDPIKIVGIITQLLYFLTTDFSSELVAILIDSLGLREKLVSLKKTPELASAIHYVLFKLSSASKLGFDHEIVDTDILEVIDSSVYARFKILFEVIDQNYKTDFKTDFQLVFALEKALSSQLEQFSFIYDSIALCESGSSFSIDAVFNYTAFIIQNSLLKFIDPKRSLPLSFQESSQLRKFPPLPRSDFLGFDILEISKSQLNLRNFKRLVNALHFNTRIIGLCVTEQIKNKDVLNLVDDFNSKKTNLEFQTNSIVLNQIFTVLFSNLIIIDQLKSKAYEFKSDLSPVFYDYLSLSNMLKIHTVVIFEKLFQLHGTFAFFKFLKFIESTSFEDLQLQNFSIIILNHLLFHSSIHSELQITALENTFIKELLVKYISSWNSGDEHYEQIVKLLSIKHKPYQLQSFDKAKYLHLLGTSDSTNSSKVNTISPAPSISSSTNFNMNSNLNALQKNSSGNSITPITSVCNSQNANLNYQYLNQGQRFEQSYIPQQQLHPLLQQTGSTGSNYDSWSNNYAQQQQQQNYIGTQENQRINVARNAQSFIPSSVKQHGYINKIDSSPDLQSFYLYQQQQQQQTLNMFNKW